MKTKITLKKVKAGAVLPIPIYVTKPYIVLSTEDVVLAAGDVDYLKSLDGYFDECPVEVREHDLHMNDNTKTHTPETVGRKYQQTWFAVHSRRIGTNEWYGASRYKTEQEAKDAIASLGKRFENVGGIAIDFGAATQLYEYRIVRLVADCEVVYVENRKV